MPNPQKDEDYALLPLTWTFEDGGAYALLGPSGCGKTTLLNIISGLLRPSQGTVLFDGKDVTGDAAGSATSPRCSSSR
jgi:glycerol transport system ATP-binding protein